MIQLPNSSLVHFEKGETLFRQGDLSKELYLIHSGKVQVRIEKNGKEIPIVTLEKDSFVGEMSFISGIPRTATVTALTPVVASALSADLLSDEVCGLSDWCLSIAKGLVQKLHRATSLLSGLNPAQNLGPEQIWDNLLVHQKSELAPGRLYLNGYFHAGSVNMVKEKIRELKLKGQRPIVLDFSRVVDIDIEVLDYVSALTQMGGKESPEILLENVQLIRDKVVTLKGIRNIMSKTAMPRRRVEQGEFLIRQDQTDASMYVVRSGRFKIFRYVDGKEVLLSYAEPGEVVGEMALIKEGSRAASVRAEKTSVVYVIDIEALHHNKFNVPEWFMKVLETLTARIRNTNLMTDEIIKNRGKRRQKVDFAHPIGLILDHDSPGLIVLQGHLIVENMEFLSYLIHGSLAKDVKQFTLDLSRVKSIDPDAIRFLMTLSMSVKSAGGNVAIRGPHKDLLMLLKQYDLQD